jgi:predicted ATPase
LGSDRYPNAQIFLLGGETIREVTYAETEHFAVTRDFLNNHERMLKALLEGGADRSREDD